MNEVSVAVTVNGVSRSLELSTAEMLVDTLRDRLGLTGTNVGCDHASCGACTVMIDGSPQASCSTFTWRVDGAEVTTIEGLGSPGDLSPEQRAFADASAFQCGYCTPGLIVTAAALLREHSDPDIATVTDWISSNICRCTGYQMVIEAVLAAATLRVER